MIHHLTQYFGAPCPGGNFLSFPTWHKYLDGVRDPATGLCSPQLGGLNDVWLVVAALIEILLRVAALLAVGFVIYGAVSYMMSQGDADKTTKARHTIINAVVGLAIAIIAGATVGFIAGRFN